MKVDGLRESAKRAATIGEFIREQREQAQVSLRQLARLAGVSNPYLSQIERGLRKPSADILQQIAKGLRISAEQLYVRAGILESRHGDPEVVAAILADTVLTERQKQVIVEIYEVFRKENAQDAASDDVAVQDVAAHVKTTAVNGKAATATEEDRRSRHVDHK
jgi:transcriptional regulator with XRE-family HTH domain